MHEKIKNKPRKAQQTKKAKSPWLIASLIVVGVATLFATGLLLNMLVSQANEMDEATKVAQEKQRYTDTKHLLSSLKAELSKNEYLADIIQGDDGCPSVGSGINTKIVCNVSLRIVTADVDKPSYDVAEGHVTNTLQSNPELKLVGINTENISEDGKKSTYQKIKYTKYPELDCRKLSTFSADSSYFLFIECKWEPKTLFSLSW